jgi:hypothetical protein
MCVDPCNCSLKILESIWDSNSHNGSSLGSVRVHSVTLFCTLGNMRYDFRASLLACNLANPCLGHEPKARVATRGVNILSTSCCLEASVKLKLVGVGNGVFLF